MTSTMARTAGKAAAATAQERSAALAGSTAVSADCDERDGMLDQILIDKLQLFMDCFSKFIKETRRKCPQKPASCNVSNVNVYNFAHLKPCHVHDVQMSMMSKCP